MACAECYAYGQWAARYRPYQALDLWRRDGIRAVTSAGTWSQPLKWERQAAAEGRAHRVFCASLADVFEDRRDLDELRARLWELIGATPHLTWQLLTKRAEHVTSMIPWVDDWPANVWLGMSAESQRWADERIPVLREIPAWVRFVSAEPLTEAVALPLDGIARAILGGMDTRKLAALFGPPVPSRS
jgi:protein gp37